MPASRRKHDSDLMRYADLGIRLAATAGLFLFLGWKADEWLGTRPWLLLLGGLVGFSGGMYSVVRAVDSLDERERPPSEKGRDSEDAPGRDSHDRP